MTEKLCKNKCHNYNGYCKKNAICRFDIPLTKDRSISRNRHHSKEKSKKRLYESARILESKAKRIPYNATLEQIDNAEKRVINAYKKLHIKYTPQ